NSPKAALIQDPVANTITHSTPSIALMRVKTFARIISQAVRPVVRVALLVLHARVRSSTSVVVSPLRSGFSAAPCSLLPCLLVLVSFVLCSVLLMIYLESRGLLLVIPLLLLVSSIGGLGALLRDAQRMAGCFLRVIGAHAGIPAAGLALGDLTGLGVEVPLFFCHGFHPSFRVDTSHHCSCNV